ncbi:MAG TPA: nucleoside deaminase [Chloroflexota bacterium]
MWASLEAPWQACLEEAWASYCAGSVPIGAAVADAGGRIVARGRNRIFESEANGRTLHGHSLSHAEMNALIVLDHAAVDPRTCVLYASTEPCPLCTGAVRMYRLGEVRYLARDPAAGSIALLDASPFMRLGEVRVVHPARRDVEAVVAALHVEWSLRTGRATRIVAGWEELLPEAVVIGRSALASGELASLAASAQPAALVIDRLAASLSTATGLVPPTGL